jgi:hypothetical protein
MVLAVGTGQTFGMKLLTVCWNVNLLDLYRFENAKAFAGDISTWKVSMVKTLSNM